MSFVENSLVLYLDPFDKSFVFQVLLDCCMVQGLGGLGLWKGKRATRVCNLAILIIFTLLRPIHIGFGFRIARQIRSHYQLFRPINNRSIVVQRPHGLALRPHTDHFKFSEDIWSM